MRYKGNIVLVQDADAAIGYVVNAGYKVIALSEDSDALMQYLGPDNVIKATVLLPPCDAMSALIDNNVELFNNIYMNYLLTNEECVNFQDILILSILRGINLVIYIQKDELELGFFNSFHYHMLTTRGISIGIAMTNTPFTYVNDVNFDAANSIRLYNQGWIDALEFMQNYPPIITVHPPLLYNLLTDLYGYDFMTKLTKEVDITSIWIMLSKELRRIQQSGDSYRKVGFLTC